MKKRPIFTMTKQEGYGMYAIHRILPSGKMESQFCDESQLWDRHESGKAGTAELRRKFEQLKNKCV